MCQTAGGEADVVFHNCARAHTHTQRRANTHACNVPATKKAECHDVLTRQGQVHHFHHADVKAKMIMSLSIKAPLIPIF